MKPRLKKSRIVRRTAADIKPPTPKELARLRRAMNGPIDTSDIPEQVLPGRYPVIRDDRGRIPTKPRSLIREAILGELGRRKMTRYELWKRARQHCSTLPNSAVYEFLLGRRAISIDYCEAMLKALNLGVTCLRRSA
jgi:hypothetical protein